MSASEWRPAKLDQLGHVGRGRSRHRPRNADFLYGGPYPFFQTGDIKAANYYLNDYSQTYSEAGLAQSKLWRPGTLCITIAANIAESAILGIEGCFPDSIVGFVADPEKADVRFVKYYLEILKLRMQGISHGATQDNLSLDKLLTFDFLVPPLPIQRRIAGILSAYDDLIENSQRRIKILEEMARRLYREWFVYFRFPGHEDCRFVESPLGEIPEGWEVRKLRDVCRLTMGQSPKSETYNELGIGMAFHQGVSDFGNRYPTDRLFCTADGRMAVAGDILFSVRAPVGRMNIANKPIILGRGLSAIRHLQDFQAFLWEQLRNSFTKIDMIGNGAIFASVTKEDMQGIDLLCPPYSLIVAATNYIEPLHSEIATLSQQIPNLRLTRDLLLPRLLSGQIEVDSLPEPVLSEP
jgi:type I restriction enzyme S subunit